MNILYLSRLSGKKGSGPYFSIPNQVAAQKSYDNVFWYNLNNVEEQFWKDTGNVHTCNEYPDKTLSSLPVPFSTPDIVIVEEQYEFFNCKIIREIQKARIPYIIVPRCSLTNAAQRKKALKKSIANFLYFNTFIKKAAGIQYLTEDEKNASGNRWNDNGIVIPNGIKMSEDEKKFSSNKINCVFIGRIDLYHKGLDLLLKAWGELKDTLKENNVRLCIYGTGADKDILELNNMINAYAISDIVQYKDAIYDERKREVLLESDVFVLTSRFEGMPMGVLEALSYGIPVIITKGTNMTQMVNETNAGWTSEGTIEGIKESIQKMILQKQLLYKYSLNAKALAKEYSWDRIAEQSHLIYEEIVKKKDKRG